MKNYLFACIVFLLFSCSSSNKQEYEYTKLEDFKNDTLAIKEGTPVQIIGFSGGKDNDKKNVYYQQILVKNKETGDTLSILCPLLKIPQADINTGRIYITPLEFNPEKKVTDATFEKKTNSMNILLQTLGDLAELKNNSVDVTSYMEEKMVKNELVAVNKSIPLFQNKYKTVIGTLSFTVDPR